MRLTKAEITAIQSLFVRRGVLYKEADGVWCQQTQQAYQWYHQHILHKDITTLPHPTRLQDLPTPLRRAAKITEADLAVGAPELTEPVPVVGKAGKKAVLKKTAGSH